MLRARASRQLLKRKAKVDSGTSVSLRDGRIVVSGPLTFQTVPPLVSQASTWLQQDNSEFTVDLSGVSRADSAGVALLLEWWQTLHAAQRRLTYTGVPGQVETFIRINGLDSTLLK